MMKIVPVWLCAAMVACASDETTSEVDENVVVSLPSTHSFSASSGNGVVLRVADSGHTAFAPGFTVYGPAGNKVTWGAGADVASAAFQATATGNYSVTIYDTANPASTSASYSLYLMVAPGAPKDGALSPGGSVLAHLDEGELDSYTFTAATGEGIALRVTDVAGGSLWPGFTIYGPAGNVVTWGSGADVASASFQPTSSGTYTVVVYDLSTGLASTGDYKLYYTKAPGANHGGALTSGGVVLAHIDEGALDSYTFTALTGDDVALRVTDITGGSLWPGFTVYGPPGNVVTWGSGPDLASAAFQARSSGTYTVVIYDLSTGLASTGDYRVDYTRTLGP